MLRTVLLASAAALAVMKHQPALAQDGDAGTELGQTLRLEEIVVTAEKLDRTLFETTSSITVYTGAELEARSFDDLYDVVLRTPNVAQSFGDKGFNIRGIDQRQGAGAGLLINTIVDGAALPNNQATFFGPYSTWDVAQIEILRGPQGTSQGRNAIGGAIIVNSADPNFDGFDGRARAAAGELGERRIALAQNIELVDDVLAVRLAGEHREIDGWVENPIRNDDEYDAREATMLRGKILWQPVESFQALLTSRYTDSVGGEDLVDFTQFPDRRVNLSNRIGEEGSVHRINTLKLDWEATDRLAVTAISTLYDHDYTRREDIDQSPAEAGFLERLQDDESVVHELRATYDAERWRGVAGFYYGNFINRSDDLITVPVSFLGVPVDLLQQLGIDPASSIFQDRRNKSSDTNLAGFAEIEFNVTDRLTLIAGARYDSETRTNASQLSTRSAVPLPPFLPLPPDEIEASTAEFEAFLPKIGVRYELQDNLSFGFVAQQAYRAGGRSISTVSATVADFDPEFAWTYEGSVRALLWQERVALSANVFYTRWTDQQLSRALDPLVPIDTITVNAGESELYGAEASVDVIVTEGLTGFFSLGLLETEYVDFRSATGDLTGNEFALAPSVSLSFGADYRHPSGFVARADAAYTGERFSDPENNADGEMDSYWVTNAKIGYEQERWSAFVYARNLFDEDYPAQIQTTVLQARTAEPRVVGIEINVSWGS